MPIVTRKPTGKPAWPITLIAGMPGAGKTQAAVEASASPLIARTYWIGYGESDPDDYGALPGVDYDIVEHDGTIAGVLGVIAEIAAQPVPDGGRALVVLDSSSRFWETLSERVEIRAGARNARQGEGKVDLWAEAKNDWQRLLAALRQHQGPSILTARYEDTDRGWRIRGEKGAAFDVDAVVEMRERGSAVLTKVTSAVLQIEKPLDMPHFTLHDLWTRLGLSDDAGERTFRAPTHDRGETRAGPDRDWDADIASATTAEELTALGAAATRERAPAAVLDRIRAARAAFVLRGGV